MTPTRFRHFSRPHVLQSLSPESVRALLRPYTTFLRDAGVPFPEDDAPYDPDYDALAHLLVTSPEGIPAELADAILAIDTLATADGRDTLLSAIPQLDASRSDWTAADLVVHAWIHRREVVELLAAQMGVTTRCRSFRSFPAPSTLEIPRVLPSATLAAMESDLATQFEARGRGESTRLAVSRREDGLWILVRHGSTFHREACIGSDGRSASIGFRPEKYDILVLDSVRRELRIAASSRWQKELYRRVVGRHLFGDDEAFPTDDKYTLWPLLTLGEAALACPEVPEITWLRLTWIDYIDPGRGPLRSTHTTPDLFALSRQGLWSIPSEARLISARFLLKLRGVARTHAVTVTPPNLIRYGVESDAFAVEQWLERRGFLILSGGGRDDSTVAGTLLACA